MVSLSRDSNPGWGDWRRSVVVVWAVLFVLFLFLGNIYVSAFACHATGLDAVQRLEQKKSCQVFPKAFLSKTNVRRALSLKSLRTTNDAQHTLSVSLARA